MGKFIGFRAWQEQWSENMGKSKDWVVWCRSRKKDEEQGPFEVDEKEVFSNRSKQAKPKTGASKPNPKQERRRIEKEEKGSECAGKHDGDRATSNAQ